MYAFFILDLIINLFKINYVDYYDVYLRMYINILHNKKYIK